MVSAIVEGVMQHRALRQPAGSLSSSTGQILHATAREHYWSGVGALSIKSFVGGHAFYEVGDARYMVDEQRYLVLNQGQTYTITVESETPVTSFCIFFAPGLVEDVHHSLTRPDNTLLTMPTPSTVRSINFFEQTYRHDQLVSPLLHGLRTTCTQNELDASWLDEQLHATMQQLLQVHHQIYQIVEALPAARLATREELYRRVQCAKDYADALFDTSVTLDELAQVAGLSPNHLLRTFRQLCGQTPHQYIIMRRLERAQNLLQHTDQSVTDICYAVGFHSLGSFSRLFRDRIGVSPDTFRRQTR